MSDRAQTAIRSHHPPDPVASGTWFGSKSPGHAAVSTDRERADRDHRPPCGAKCEHKTTCATRGMKPLRQAKKATVSSTKYTKYTKEYTNKIPPSPPQGSLYHTIRSVFSAGPSTSRPHAGASDSLASMFSLDGGLPPSNHVSDHAGRACGVLLQTSSGLR